MTGALSLPAGLEAPEPEPAHPHRSVSQDPATPLPTPQAQRTTSPDPFLPPLPASKVVPTVLFKNVPKVPTFTTD